MGTNRKSSKRPSQHAAARRLPALVRAAARALLERSVRQTMQTRDRRGHTALLAAMLHVYGVGWKNYAICLNASIVRVISSSVIWRCITALTATGPTSRTSIPNSDSFLRISFAP